MKIREILRVLDARLVWGESLLEEEVATACASDQNAFVARRMSAPLPRGPAGLRTT